MPYTDEYQKASGGRNRGDIPSLPALAAMLAGMLFVLLSGLSSAPQKNWDEWGRHEKQYEELTAALMAGQLSLLEEPAAFLSELENPYDPVARSIAGSGQNAYALIDTAWYRGKYYTYFGLTPALLLFIPVYLITGRILPSWIAVIFTAVLCVPAAFLFVRALCRRFFPESKASARILLSLSLIGALGIPYLAAFCTTYSMPAVMGILLSLLGLCCFLSASSDNDPPDRRLLITGSLLLSLTIGCRPVFAAAFFLAFPIFSGAIRRGDFFRPRHSSVINTLCILLPALLIGSCFLVFNYLRFDDPLEFGFHYLLTTRDLAHGGHTPGETLAGAYLLLLRPPILHRVFPFMEIADYNGRYSDSLYVEPLFGGLLPLHPILPLGLLVSCLYFLRALYMKRAIRPSSVSRECTPPLPGLALTSLGLGLLILLLDSSLAGISQRYESDFALFLFLPAALAFLSVEDCIKRSGNRRLLPLLYALLLLITLSECFLSFAAILCDDRYFAMRDWNPDAYNRIASFFHR